ADLAVRARCPLCAGLVRVPSISADAGPGWRRETSWNTRLCGGVGSKKRSSYLQRRAVSTRRRGRRCFGPPLCRGGRIASDPQRRHRQPACRREHECGRRTFLRHPLFGQGARLQARSADEGCWRTHRIAGRGRLQPPVL
ncbi:MAG: hypothetical protein AVDCRST_MAG23-2568, partial [uncultured Sphingosinicella sp.]